MEAEFSAAIIFKDSGKNAYAMRVFVKIGDNAGAIDTSVWCDLSWEDLCMMLGQIEQRARKDLRLRKPKNGGHLHVVRQ